MPRCITCKLPLNKGSVSGLCRQCHVSLRAFPAPSDITADLKARQARRRALKLQLADLLRIHAANRAEIAKKILTFVGFDLPGHPVVVHTSDRVAIDLGLEPPPLGETQST